MIWLLDFIWALGINLSISFVITNRRNIRTRSDIQLPQNVFGHLKYIYVLDLTTHKVRNCIVETNKTSLRIRNDDSFGHLLFTLQYIFISGLNKSYFNFFGVHFDLIEDTKYYSSITLPPN